MRSPRAVALAVEYSVVMRILTAFVLTLCMLCVAPRVQADDFSPGDLDKQAHMAVSYSITLTGSVILRRYQVTRWKAVAISVAAAMALGTFKELVLDATFSPADELANGIGAGVAAGLVFAFEL